MMRKAYILLELELEVNFADTISFYVYESKKNLNYFSNISRAYTNAHVKIIYANLIITKDKKIK